MKDYSVKLNLAIYIGNDERIDVNYDVLHDDARKFQYSMMFGLIGCYVLSGCLYILTYYLMCRRSRYAMVQGQLDRKH